MKTYHLLPENVLRQYTDACIVYEELCRVNAKASEYAGGMYWKAQGAYTYLIRTAPDNRQIRLGARSAETEQMYTAFHQTKTEIKARLRHLRDAVSEAERLNKALRVGRVPPSVVDFIVRSEGAGVAGLFTVLGSAALFAYETRAGVRLSKEGTSVRNSRSFADVRDGIQISVDAPTSDRALLQMLQLVDETFHWKKTTRPPLAVNEHAFGVECLRCLTLRDGSTPYRHSKAGNLEQTSPGIGESMRADDKLQQIVVATTGRMAVIRTVSPQTFIRFMTSLMSDSGSDDLEERRCTLLQIDAVQRLLDDKLLER
ncbi:GSU2403 family nucleotidyltransferase fold protein [Paraburkholderia caribensis]|uniref:GSU2403 family nucleotidyltransferase fold protein n=1 Tax=Paraburkholderia caribensis TaxID=75105 RepID=UPI0015928C14|nr:GSU2403 family nucleotidyltransferase fold protein [Paraburkholderia caribensis]